MKEWHAGAINIDTRVDRFYWARILNNTPYTHVSCSERTVLLFGARSALFMATAQLSFDFPRTASRQMYSAPFKLLPICDSGFASDGEHTQASKQKHCRFLLFHTRHSSVSVSHFLPTSNLAAGKSAPGCWGWKPFSMIARFLKKLMDADCEQWMTLGIFFYSQSELYDRAWLFLIYLNYLIFGYIIIFLIFRHLFLKNLIKF